MVSIDDTNTEGRRNRFENNTIVEQFDKDFPKNARFYHGLEREFRLVFEKLETNGERTYKFHGLYKLIDTKEDQYIRTLKKQSDEYNF